MKIGNFKLIMYGCLLIISIGFGLYFAMAIRVFLSDGKGSNSFSELANFSTYNSYFIYVCNLVLLGFISYITYQSTNNYNIQQTTPVLDFRVSTSNVKNNTDSWFLFNGTNASARNISLRFFNGDLRSTRWIACYSMGKDAEIELTWLKFAHSIEVVYSDLLEYNFYKTTYRNLRSNLERISEEEFRSIVESRRINSMDLNLQHNFYLNDVPNRLLNGTDIYIYVDAFAL